MPSGGVKMTSPMRRTSVLKIEALTRPLAGQHRAVAGYMFDDFNLLAVEKLGGRNRSVGFEASHTQASAPRGDEGQTDGGVAQQIIVFEDREHCAEDKDAARDTSQRTAERWMSAASQIPSPKATEAAARGARGLDC